MVQFPGWPCNDFDFHFEEAGGALAGLFMRDVDGHVIPGVLTSSESLLSAGEGWKLRVAPFVAVRSKGRSALMGGSTDDVVLDVATAPTANARLDVVYTLPADVGAGDAAVAVAIITGAPSAVPAKPAIPVGAIELGTLRVSARDTGSVQSVLTETFPFAALLGTPLPVRKVADLASKRVADGTAATVLSDGSGALRVRGEWVASKTAPYTAPFKPYNNGGVIFVDVAEGLVTVSGVMSAGASDIPVSGGRQFGNIGEKWGPPREIQTIGQGSGTNHWLVTIATSGVLSASRYGPGAAIANTWLPFSVTYPMKRK